MAMTARRPKPKPKPAPPSMSSVVASNLRALKAIRRETDTSLATRMGVTRSWVQERLTEVRRIDLDALEAFADAFGVPANELLYAPWDSNPEPNVYGRAAAAA